MQTLEQVGDHLCHGP